MKRILALLLAVTMISLPVFTTISVAKKTSIPLESGDPVKALTGLEQVQFSDIKGHWAENQISYLVNKEIIKGMKIEKNIYAIKPDKTITLSEYISLMVKIKGLKVEGEELEKPNIATNTPWYKESMDIGISKGLLDGLPVETRKPEKPLTRAELANITVKANGWGHGDLAGAVEGFKDISESDWFYKSVTICNVKNLIKGYEDKTFRPQEQITRAEAFTIIYNFIEKNIGTIQSKKLFNSYGAPIGKNQVESLEKSLSVVWDTYAPRDEATSSVVFTKPISNSNFPVTVENKKIDVEGFIKGKKIEKIFCSVKNNNGSGNMVEYITKVPAVVSAVYEENGLIITHWNFKNIEVMNNANTITIQAIDDKSNIYEGYLVILKDIDSDKDGICDFYERLYGTKPRKADRAAANELGYKIEENAKAKLLWEALNGIRFSDTKTMEDILAQAYLSLMGFSLGKYGPNKNGVDGVIGYGTNAQIAAFQKKNGVKAVGFNIFEDNLDFSVEEMGQIRKTTIKLLQKAYFAGETFESLGLPASITGNSKYLQNENTKVSLDTYLESYGIEKYSINSYERLYASKDLFTRIKRKLNSYNSSYPDITKIIKIGKSVKGQDLLVFKMGNGKKKLFINAEHHPREYITTILTLNQIEHLLMACDKNLVIDGINIKELLNTVSIYFMPVVNPDGLDICLNGNPSMYTNANGVEINSNYDAFVDEGDNYSKLTGGYPFSQPETKAIKDLCEKENFDMSIAYHAAGEIVFWNYGQKYPDLQRDKDLATIIKNTTGYALVSPTAKNTDKGFKDWVVSRLKKPSFTIEVGKGAITKALSFTEYETILTQNLKVPLYMAYTLSKKDVGPRTPQKISSGQDDLNPKPESKQNIESTVDKLLKAEEGVYSIYFEDLKDGQKYSKNNQKMPSASIIKLFVMAEAFNQIKQGKIKKEDTIVITSSEKVGGTGSLQSIKGNVEKTISDLIFLMIAESDNTATNALIKTLGMGNINTMIKSLGCSDTVLQRKMMDLESIKIGKDNFTSIQDLGLFYSKLYKSQCIDNVYDKEMLEILKKQKSNTKLPALLPEKTVVAHKTGELGGVENDAGIVYSPKGDYIICVLTQNLPDTNLGIYNISKVSKALYDLVKGK